MKSVTLRTAVIILLLVPVASSGSSHRRAALLDPGDVISTKHIDVVVTPHVETPRSVASFAERLDVTFDVDSEPVKKRFIRLSDYNDVRLSTIGPNGIEDVTSRSKRQWATYRSDDDQAAMLVKKDTRGRLLLEGSLRHANREYLIQPSDRSGRHVMHRARRNCGEINAPKKSESQEDTNTYVVELVIMFDYSMLERWRGVILEGQNGVERLREYAAIIVNEMAYMFRSLYKYGTDVQVKLTHVLVVTDPANNPYNSSLIENGQINHKKFVDSFSAWATLNIIGADDVLLFTGHTFTPKKIVGATYRSGVCSEKNQVVISSAASRYGIATMTAHELGHSLGMYHDDDKGCPLSYIMRGLISSTVDKTNPENHWRFSKCSVASFDKFMAFLTKNGKNCLLTTSTTTFSDTIANAATPVDGSDTKMWGAELTLDQQCNTLMPGTTFCRNYQMKYPISEICYGLYCGDPMKREGGCFPFIPFAGTQCGHYKICKHDQCIDSEEGAPMDDKCQYGEARHGFIGEERLTCQQAVAKDPGYCYLHATECCVSCPVIAKKHPEKCPYGEAQRGFIGEDLLTCTAALAEDPGYCHFHSEECCVSCPVIAAETNDEQCRYGQVQHGFIGEQRMTCLAALAKDPGYCYFHAEKCCLSCPRLARRGTSSCPYGEVKHGFIGEEAMTCEKALDEDHGYCYFHADKCCESCPKIATNYTETCPYGEAQHGFIGEERLTCQQALAKDPGYCYLHAKECCVSCPVIAAKTNDEKCPYGEAQHEFIGEELLTCQQALAKDPGYCYLHSKECCVSCPVIAANTNDESCRYGDYPKSWTIFERTFLSCAEAVREHPGLCYRNGDYEMCCNSCQLIVDTTSSCFSGDHLKEFSVQGKQYGGCKEAVRHHPGICYENANICCKTCSLLFDASSPGCEYGNRPLTDKIKSYDTCEKAIAAEPYVCYDSNVEKLCCKSCGDIKNSENEKCPYGEAQEGFIGEDRMTCQEALAKDPGYCYFHAQKCCVSCLPLGASGRKSCPYGEFMHGFIGENALTCEKALEEDPGYCYFHADKCCESCPKIAKNYNEQCPYGEAQHGFIGAERWTCDEALAKDPGYCYLYARECCVSCPLIAPKTNYAGCEYGNRPLTETIMGYDTCEEAIAAEPHACYDSNVERLCCKSCGDIKNSENAGCEYGDKPREFQRYKSCIEAVAAKPGRCYEEEIAQKCCKSCGDHKSSQPGCPYGNRLGKQFTDRSGKRRQCKAINVFRSYYCYDYADVCCGSCHAFKTNIAGCEYGDRHAGCKSWFKRSPESCKYESQEEKCCKTCADAANKKAP